MSSYDDDDDNISSIIIFRPSSMALGKDSKDRIFISVDDLIENLEGLRLELEMKTLEQDEELAANATIMIITIDVIKGIVEKAHDARVLEDEDFHADDDD